MFPPDPPVPVLTWGVDFPNGNVSGDVTVGTVLGTLSGASTYAVLDYNGATPSHLVASGSNLVTNNFLAAGSYRFYIRGVDAGGVPGIDVNYTMTVNGNPSPTLTSVFVYQIGPVSATVSVGTNIADGTIYWIVDTSATPPSDAQIIAGHGSGGGAAIASGNQLCHRAEHPTGLCERSNRIDGILCIFHAHQCARQSLVGSDFAAIYDDGSGDGVGSCDIFRLSPEMLV